MTHCIRCGRSMKHASESGLGPVCAKRAKPAASVERDLFGFDVDKAAEAARHRLSVGVEVATIDALAVIRASARAARVRATASSVSSSPRRRFNL